MSRVPRIRFKGFEEDWEQRKLGEVIQERNIRTSDFDRFPIFSLTIESGITPKTERYERGSLVTKTEDLFKVVKPNEFVTNPMNLRFGALGYNTQEYDISVSGYYDVFSIDGNNCSGFWNAYFKTQHVMNIFDNLATGSLVEKKRVKYSTLKKIYLYMPSTIEEKNKVSKFMIFTDHLITLHQRKLEKLKIIKKSMFENLFPQNGEKTPKIRFSGFNEDWEQRKLLSITTMHARIGWQNLRTTEFLDDGKYLLITGTDFVDGKIDFTRCYYVKQERYNQDRNIQIKNGCLLITKDGTLGKVAYVNGLNKPATLNAGIFNVEIRDENKVDRLYLYQYIKAPFLLEYVNQMATGGTIKHLNQNILVDFMVSMPQIVEQKKIGELFQTLDHLITLHQSKLDKLQKIKKSMLESMFV